VRTNEAAFADVDEALAAQGPADRPRLRRLVDELGRMAQLTPALADRCYAGQARLLMQLEEYEQALLAVEKGLLLMPQDDGLMILRGDIHRAADEFSRALQDYTEVLKARPNSVTARVRRAELRQARGQFAEALVDVNAALQYEPRSLRLVYRRGLILMDLGRVKDAQTDFQAVVRLGRMDVDLKQKALERLRELGQR
jgi:tetratricopeptide (TPR) repeat protein